jgi:hypothetical protein
MSTPLYTQVCRVAVRIAPTSDSRMFNARLWLSTQVFDLSTWLHKRADRHPRMTYTEFRDVCLVGVTMAMVVAALSLVILAALWLGQDAWWDIAAACVMDAIALVTSVWALDVANRAHIRED